MFELLGSQLADHVAGDLLADFYFGHDSSPEVCHPRRAT
jgi:hypothetical protein